MARKSGFIRRGGRMVRETAWIGGLFQNTTLAAATTATLTSSLNAAALALRPFTVIRTRGVIGIRSDQSSVSEIQNAMFGQCVVSDQAVAIGVTAVPTPFTDNASDVWMVLEALFGALLVTSDIGRLLSGGQVDRTFDSKAMRKVEDGQDVITVVETAGGSSGAIITEFSRLLVKLH